MDIQYNLPYKYLWGLVNPQEVAATIIQYYMILVLYDLHQYLTKWA